MQKAIVAGSVVAVAMAFSAAPGAAAPVVFNSNFVSNDATANSFNNNNLFFIQNWKATGFASNSNTDPSSLSDLTRRGSFDMIGTQVRTPFCPGHPAHEQLPPD